MYNFVTFATWIQSRLWPAKSLTAFQSSVRTNNDGGGLAQPTQSPDTRLQAGPILAGSYPVQGGDFRYGPVCVRVQRAFVPLSATDVPRCARPSAGVLASLQGQRTDDIAMLGRCAHRLSTTNFYPLPPVSPKSQNFPLKMVLFFARITLFLSS